jgi:hypothetical protein
MKRYLASVAVVFLSLTLAQAAHLTAWDGGLWGQVDRQLCDSERTVDSTPMSDGSLMAANATISASSPFSAVEGSMSGEVTSASYWGRGLGTAVLMNARASCSSSDETADLWAYGNVSTVVPAYTGGVFFLVEGDSGEPAGTAVRIQWHWSAQAAEVSGNVTASVGNGTIYLTRNILPPAETPASGSMWSRSAEVFTEARAVEESGSFIALVGDIIGVFNNADTSASLTGEGSSTADVSTSMELLAGNALPTLVEYPYAPGLVYDPVQNITFLKDWSAAAGPMNWADADAWAQAFTFTAGSVTYSNWRLPKTIDEQGSQAGELGYLSSNYGISEAYFGPFQNISAGDYWTSPAFSRDPDPGIAYAYTFSTTFGPAQWWSLLNWECYVIPVFDGPPTDRWCPADFNNDGIVDFVDFAIFSSYWLQQKPVIAGM